MNNNMADDERKAALERQRALLKSRKKNTSTITVSNTNHSPRRRSRPTAIPATVDTSLTQSTVSIASPNRGINVGSTLMSESVVDEIILDNEVRTGNAKSYEIKPVSNYSQLQPIASGKGATATVEQEKIQDKLRDLGMDNVVEPAVGTRFEQSTPTSYSESPAPNPQYMDVQPPQSNTPQRSRRPSEMVDGGVVVAPMTRTHSSIAEDPPPYVSQTQQQQQQQQQQPQQPQQQQQPQQPQQQQPQQQPLFGPNDQDRINFVGSPAPEGQTVKCIIKRHKGNNKRFPVYILEAEQVLNGQNVSSFLLCAQKRTGQKTSNYIISHSQGDLDREGDGFIGKLRSNFVGTQFTCYDNGINPEKVVKQRNSGRALRKELTSIIYEKNYLGMKGPRQMTILIPALDQNQVPYVVQPAIKRDSLLERFQMSRTTDLIQLVNKKPQWNEATQSYVLNFKGRVTEASVKNFQLVHEKDQEYVILQFGRVESDVFTMDFQYPMTAVQAFAISLSSFDSKLACE